MSNSNDKSKDTPKSKDEIEQDIDALEQGLEADRKANKKDTASIQEEFIEKADPFFSAPSDDRPQFLSIIRFIMSQPEVKAAAGQSQNKNQIKKACKAVIQREIESYNGDYGLAKKKLADSKKAFLDALFEEEDILQETIYDVNAKRDEAQKRLEKKFFADNKIISRAGVEGVDFKNSKCWNDDLALLNEELAAVDEDLRNLAATATADTLDITEKSAKLERASAYDGSTANIRTVMDAVDVALGKRRALEKAIELSEILRGGRIPVDLADDDDDMIERRGKAILARGKKTEDSFMIGTRHNAALDAAKKAKEDALKPFATSYNACIEAYEYAQGNLVAWQSLYKKQNEIAVSICRILQARSPKGFTPE